MGHASFRKYELSDIGDESDRNRRRLIMRGVRKPSRSEHSKRPYTVVDLFCGCGGISTGLESTGRFRTVIGIDISASALQSFRQNHGTSKFPVKAISEDLAELDPLRVRSELRKIRILTGELDCLVGGPPCEGFSQNKGARRDARSRYDFYADNSHATRFWDTSEMPKKMNEKRRRQQIRAQRTDVRNDLFRVILRVAAVTRPRFVLIENVRDILTYADGAIIDEIVSELTLIGYRVEVAILNAADYGVPQLRKRAFIIGTRNDILGSSSASAFPLPTHRGSINERSGERELPGDKGLHVSVWEAIGDLPLPRSTSGVRSRAANLRRLAISDFRRYARRDISVMNHEERAISKGVLARIRAMRPGMRTHDLPARLRTKKFFYNAYARLEWNKPANTITKSFANIGSGKFSHPIQDRGLTIREAARLQSFPDDFVFNGKSVRDLACMIGGAVPPLLARAIGVRFSELLDADRKNKPWRNNVRRLKSEEVDARARKAP